MPSRLFASPAAYQQAARLLAAGQAVALPTETVYGLAADAANESAVQALYDLKGRPPVKPLPVLVSGPAQAAELAQISPLAGALMQAFWPGPLTLVLPLKPGADIAPTTLAGGQTIALRCADIDWARQSFYADYAAPLALTSANTSGRPAPAHAQAVMDDLGARLPLLIDGGPCKTGTASTIVTLDGGGQLTIIRQGALAATEIMNAVKAAGKT